MSASRVLLVEDNPGDALLVRTLLAEASLTRAGRRTFEFSHVDRLAAGLAELAQHPVDVVLLDLSLPDSSGLETLTELRKAAPVLPVIVMSGQADEAVALAAVQHGAQDYLVKGRVDSDLLARAIDYAVERARQAGQLRLRDAALAAAANAVVITDGTGQILWANPAFTQLSGYTLAEALGRNPRDLVRSGQHDHAFYQALWETLQAGQVWQGEIINRRKDGQVYTEDMTITPVSGGMDGAVHFVAIKQDATERTQRAREREVVVTVAAALRGAELRADLLPVIVQQVVALYPVAVAALVLVEAAGLENVVAAVAGPAAEPLLGLRLPAGAGLTGRIIASRQPYTTATLSQEALASAGERFPPNLEHAVGVPLLTQAGALGMLWAVSRQPLTESERRSLGAIADMAANALRRVISHEQTERRLRHIMALRAVDTAISQNFDMRVVLDILIHQVIVQLQVDAAAVLLLDPATLSLKYAAGEGLQTWALSRSGLRLGHGAVGAAALRQETLLRLDPAADPEFARSTLAQAEGVVAYAAAPLVAKGQIKGMLEVFWRARPRVDAEWVNYLEALAEQAAIAVENASLFQALQRSNQELSLAYDETIAGWTRALDLRDRETEGHTERVTIVALRLAQTLQLPEAELVQIRRGALLHDIGKMGVPDAVLLKPGPLNEAEWALMRRHPTLAHEMLAPIAFLRPALDIPYCHHEKWDGRGYPRGLAGETIPLAARLFALVDVWDALRSARPYRPAWPDDQVRAYLREQAGHHFDPHLAQIFLHFLERGAPD